MESEIPTTGIQVVDDALKVLGAIYVLISVLAVVLPQSWPFTQWCAKLAADIRGMFGRRPAP